MVRVIHVRRGVCEVRMRDGGACSFCSLAVFVDYVLDKKCCLCSHPIMPLNP